MQSLALRCRGNGVHCNSFFGWATGRLNSHAIIIPTPNERENVGLLVEEIVELGLDSKVISIQDDFDWIIVASK